MKTRDFQKRCRECALTLTELLVFLGVLGVLVFFVFMTILPSLVVPSLVKGQMIQVLSNMRQLQLAAQTMVLDGTTTGDPPSRWPGDMGSGSYSNFVKDLVPAYLSTNDFAKLMSAPGRMLPAGRISKAAEAAVLIYAVREENPTNTVFLTTANFTNTPAGGTPLAPRSVPFGAKGFVVFHKGGNGAILFSNQVGNTKAIGTYVPLCW